MAAIAGAERACLYAQSDPGRCLAVLRVCDPGGLGASVKKIEEMPQPRPFAIASLGLAQDGSQQLDGLEQLLKDQA